MNRNQQVVPIETARQLLQQRDELAEQVKALRRELQELRDERDELVERIEQLEKKLTEAERRRETTPSPEVPTESATSSDDASDESDIEQERARSKRLSAKVQELSSDLERVRRRSDQASSEARHAEKKRLLAGLADLVESIDRGLALYEDEQVRQGLRAMERQLVEFLRRENAELFGEPGDKMEPANHEAIDHVDSADHDSGEVVDVQRRGLVVDVDDTREVVFPAKVTVAR